MAGSAEKKGSDYELDKEMDIVCTTDSMITSFLFPYVDFFEKKGYRVRCFCSRTGDYFDKIRDRGVDVTEIPFTRNPFTLQNFKALGVLKKEFSKSNSKNRIAFCHEPVGGVMGRLIANIFKIPAIYMVHGFHFYRGAPLINWLVFYPFESVMAHFTDLLITINREDYLFASKRMKAKRTVFLPGVGIDTCFYSPNSALRDKTRRELGMSDQDIVLLSVGELNENKNHIAILEAMRQIKSPNLHCFIAGVGDQEEHLAAAAREYGLEKNLHLLGYRNDCEALYCAADVFCFPSYREGLPIALLEAMSSGLPVVGSRIRGNTDLINMQGGALLMPDDYAGFAREIGRLIAEPETRAHMGDYNKNTAARYDLRAVLEIFDNYLSDLNLEDSECRE